MPLANHCSISLLLSAKFLVRIFCPVWLCASSPLMKHPVLGHLASALLKRLGFPIAKWKGLVSVSLPLGPVCRLTLPSTPSPKHPPLGLPDVRLLAFLPPLRPLLLGLFGWGFSFCPASRVPCPAFYSSLHSNWEISKSMISLNTSKCMSHQARSVFPALQAPP